MYECDGYMCGSNSEPMIKVSKVKALDDMILVVSFSNGETRLFDATILEGSAFEPLKDDKMFKNITVEHGVVTWADGEIDCAPEYMYEHSCEYAGIV